MSAATQITIHMVSSLDGMIASKDNSVAWFETSRHYEKGVELSALETTDFLKTIDCYVMGSRTYEHALQLSKSYGWAYGDVPTIVVSQRKLPVERKNVQIFSGELLQLVNEELKPRYKNVWLVGGALLAREFMRLKLADELRLSILPIILGDGTPFMDHPGIEHVLQLKDVTGYKSGMVELRYGIEK